MHVQSTLGASWRFRTSRQWTPGWPDLVVVLPDVVLFVEVKAKRGKVRPDQERVHARLMELGHSVCVVRSVEELAGRVEEVKRVRKLGSH